MLSIYLLALFLNPLVCVRHEARYGRAGCNYVEAAKSSKDSYMYLHWVHGEVVSSARGRDTGED